MKDFRKTRFNYQDVRDNPMLALRMLLDLPPKPDAMTEPVAFNNVKVARQRMRNYLDEQRLLAAEADALNAALIADAALSAQG